MTHIIWSTDFQQGQFNGERKIFSINDTGTNQYSYGKKLNLNTLSFDTQNQRWKIDPMYKLKLKNFYYKHNKRLLQT